MTVATRPEIGTGLEEAAATIRSLLRDSEHEIGGVATEFRELAGETEGILSRAAAIVESVDARHVTEALERVEVLGRTASQFLERRLEATSGILETVTAEAQLLTRLSELTRAQRSIARETQTLSVLTSIEVARLGELGRGFQYLAHQLDDFSRSVAVGTLELSNHTEERRSAVEQTRRLLAIELPQIRENMGRIEAHLAGALATVNGKLTALAGTPAEFHSYVGEIAEQIAGVVAAVQAQDITRQQLEHVEESIGLIRGLHAEEGAPVPGMLAGLLIQEAQLHSVAATASDWVGRIRSCMEAILRISCSELDRIGPAVLSEVRDLSAQLQGIGDLERESQALNSEVQSTLDGLSTLMQLVGEHLERSTQVRDRLRLITFNSIIEASHLGEEADAILEISQSIKRVAAAWSAITDRSGQAMEEILGLVAEVHGGMALFSEEGGEALREAQRATQEGLKGLRGAADSTAAEVQEIEASTERLKGRIAAIGVRADGLDGCFSGIARVEEQMGAMRREWQSDGLARDSRWEQREAEAVFGAGYTTEMERAVLRAALRGEPLPGMKVSGAGNDVELF